MFYSVRYEYINRQVKLSDDLVKIFFKHMASHKRLYGKFGQLSTIRVICQIIINYLWIKHHKLRLNGLKVSGHQP
ncbi:hypothetical protein [Scopulibacillus cellulosilyticus]|uniref:Transposase n=1 Tax=Scopulibacillus cellulosilyticus TaxID=2665665 RepID=A0ABW2Q208_9BACL